MINFQSCPTLMTNAPAVKLHIHYLGRPTVPSDDGRIGSLQLPPGEADLLQWVPVNLLDIHTLHPLPTFLQLLHLKVLQKNITKGMLTLKCVKPYKCVEQFHKKQASLSLATWKRSFTFQSSEGSLTKTSMVLSSRSGCSRKARSECTITLRIRPDSCRGRIKFTNCRVSRNGISSGTGRNWEGDTEETFMVKLVCAPLTNQCFSKRSTHSCLFSRLLSFWSCLHTKSVQSDVSEGRKKPFRVLSDVKLMS